MDAPTTRAFTTRLRPWFSTSGRGLVFLALAAMFAMAVPSAFAGKNERPVSKKLAAQMQQIPPSLLGTDNRLPPQPGVGRLRQVGQ